MMARGWSPVLWLCTRGVMNIDSHICTRAKTVSYTHLFIGLWAIGIPYSLVLGVITGALSIVPFLGIIASIIPALLLGFLSAKGNPTWQWLTPVLVLGVFALVQMCESMFITPRVQSHSTGCLLYTSRCV